jgi:peptidoglycan/xylan/chitin deacetylase (PgdA/CDA1 family)
MLVFLTSCGSKKVYMEDLSGKSVDYIKEYCSNLGINVEFVEEYSDIPKGNFISQSISPGDEIGNLIVKISKGVDPSLYPENHVNELGRVPIMMYHGIHNVSAKYVGGNVDKDGYQRTSDAFRKDLEFYYSNGYRMVRLIDYVNGIIDVPMGKSSIVLTFDDGLDNNIKVLGLDDNGEIIIDPNSAVGILEEFKNKYSDFNVTATFFVNGGLFNQEEYNEKILNWLISHGYDIGNHSYSHADFSKIDNAKSVYEIGSIYKLLDSIIGDKYVNIVALPFGSPYKKSHSNFSSIMSGSYEGFDYNTLSTLRVGWESDYSPFSNDFDKSFLKRIRAYDNNGVEFDIEMNFKLLESNRYISDGDKNLIVFPKENLDKFNNFNLDYISY